MSANAEAAVPAVGPSGHAGYRKRALSIALGAGIASGAMNFWYPFLPLYLLELGATSEANALFWVALATTGQGIARFVSGPAWGILSDRVGRKPMFIRALFGATITTSIAAIGTEPWIIVVALACQGLTSGFIPAAVALTSVSVPQSKLTSSLAMVTVAQYVGRMVGPATGAILVALSGFRGAIIVSAALPAMAAVLVYFVVPKDQVGPQRVVAVEGDGSTVPEERPRVRLWNTQFLLALFLFFVTFSLSQLLNLITPVEMERLAGEASAATYAGIAFTFSGIAGVVGAVALTRWAARPGMTRVSLIGMCGAVAVGHLAFLLAGTVWAFIAIFSVTSLLYGAMLPSNNTLIAASVPPERRGSAFGWAGSAQALSFMVGPMGAAAFAAISFTGGYVVTAVILGLTTLLLAGKLRNPELGELEAESRAG